MTAFARADAALGSGRVSVELRSLNHRFLEVRTRLCPELGDHAAFVEQRLRERLSRGRVDAVVRVEGDVGPPLALDRARARAFWAELCRLRDELAPEAPVPITVLAHNPALLAPPAEGRHEAAREALSGALTAAIGGLEAARQTEGRALAVELGGRLDAARGLLGALGPAAAAALVAGRERLLDRVRRLTAELGAEPDAARLATELALVAERSDVTEELARLRIHLDHFAEVLPADEPVGRKLEFLLQELSREANTLGAKVQDATVARHVIDLKAELERLREQVQNVE